MTRYLIDDRIPKLEAALSEYMNVTDLRQLALLTKQRLPTRKADLVSLIIRHLAGGGLRAAWQALDELQRAAVAEVVHSDSTQFLEDRFRAKYGRDPDWVSSEMRGYQRTPSTLGFFFYGHGIMPDDLKERLREFVPPPVAAQIETLEQLPPAYARPLPPWKAKSELQESEKDKVPLAVWETAGAAQRQLLAVLRLIDAGKVAVGDKTRRASAATLGAITAILEGGDFYPRLPARDKWHDENAGPIRAFAWPLLVQAGGLAQLSGSKLRLTRAGRNALGDAPADTLRALWTKWIDTTIIDELSRIDCVKGQAGKGKRGLTAVSFRRDAVANALAECPVGRWISTDEFLRFARASGNDIAVAHNAWNLYIGEPQYGSLGYDGGTRILDERYVYCLLLEYAATLGMIDVALVSPSGARADYHGVWGTDDLPYFSRYDGLVYLRLTPLGAYCLGVKSAYSPPPLEAKPVLRLLPNLEIAAIGAALDQGDRLALDAYAVKVSDFVWRLDTEKLLAAIEEGRLAAEIREFLEARSAAPLPDPVARLIAEVAQRSTQLRDQGLARLIECADPALAALIAHDARTRKHCLQAGERHLVVPASSEAAFRRGLREVGYLLAPAEPRRHGGNRARTGTASQTTSTITRAE